MKAILLKEFGAADNLYLGDADEPTAAAGQILIDVYATSVNRPDIVQRQGNYPPPRGDSEILGLEVAGVVAALGDGVEGWKPGDRVMALVGGGGYAERVVAWAGHAMPIPDALDFHQAAGIVETYLTAWLNIFRLGQHSDGERILIHGGGGGVNTAAVQIVGELCPASPRFVTASPGKTDAVSALGVEHVIDYRNTDFAAVIKETTEGRGVDVILDHIGADYLAPNMKSLAVNGRLVIIGVTSGIKAELNLALMMVKRQQILGSVLRSRSVDEKSGIIADFSQRVLPLFADGRIAPQIDRVLPLAEAANAHQLMESGGHFGKIILAVDR